MLRKLLSFALAMVIVLASGTFAGAVEPSQVDPGKDMQADSAISPQYFSQSFSLDQYAMEVLVYSYSVVSGKTKLHIVSANWSPWSTIQIGFFPTDGQPEIPTSFVGTSISGTTIYTNNVPSGEYWIYIKNLGNSSITGAIDFNLYE